MMVASTTTNAYEAGQETRLIRATASPADSDYRNHAPHCFGRASRANSGFVTALARPKQGHNRRAPGPIIGAVIFCLGWLGPLATAAAQTAGSAGYDRSKEIRQSAGEILSSPEFRHFRRLDSRADSGDLPTLRQENGSEAGADAEGEGGNRERRSDSGGESSDGETRGSGPSDDGGDPPGSDDAATPADAQRRQTTVNIPAGGLLSGAFGAIYAVVAWVILAVVGGFMIYLIVKAFQNSESSIRESEPGGGNADLQGEVEPEQAPGELPADVYLTQARKLAAEGNYREAVAQLLLGAMSRIERAGLISFRRGLTYRDYLRAVRKERDKYQALQALVGVYEPLGFGRREAGEEHFHSSLSQYRSGFGAARGVSEN